MIPSERAIFQTSWVVPDLDAAARRWNETTGVGPFLINRNIKIMNSVHRGIPTEVNFSTAIAQAGPLQIELVEQHDSGPSCYRDTVSFGQEAMHHVAIMPADYDAALESYMTKGFELASSGLFGDVRFCYVDCVSTIGCMVEIIENHSAIRSFFRAIQKAAETWDGDTATLLRDL